MNEETLMRQIIETENVGYTHPSVLRTGWAGSGGNKRRERLESEGNFMPVGIELRSNKNLPKLVSAILRKIPLCRVICSSFNRNTLMAFTYWPKLYRGGIWAHPKDFKDQKSDWRQTPKSSHISRGSVWIPEHCWPIFDITSPKVLWYQSSSEEWWEYASCNYLILEGGQK